MYPKSHLDPLHGQKNSISVFSVRPRKVENWAFTGCWSSHVQFPSLHCTLQDKWGLLKLKYQADDQIDTHRNGP